MLGSLSGTMEFELTHTLNSTIYIATRQKRGLAINLRIRLPRIETTLILHQIAPVLIALWTLGTTNIGIQIRLMLARLIQNTVSSKIEANTIPCFVGKRMARKSGKTH